MKIMVTGTTGFLGGNIIELLDKEKIKYTSFSSDVMEISSFPNEDFDIVIHVAALITHRGKYTYDELYNVNVKGTSNLLKAYDKAKFIFASTTDVTRKILSPYAETKLHAEKLIREKPNNLILRYPSIFGPQQRQQSKLIPLLFKKYCQKIPCTVNNNDLREYIYVDDAASEILNNLSNNGLVIISGTKIRNENIIMFTQILKNRSVEHNSFLENPLSVTEKYLDIDVDNRSVAVTIIKLVKTEYISIIP